MYYSKRQLILTCIAAMLGILPRALAPIPGMAELLKTGK